MTLARPKSTYSTPSDPATADPLLRPSFEIPKAVRTFKQQYANLYWLRLVALRAKVAQKAEGLWRDMPGATHPPVHVQRVLDVESGKLSYIIGTVYMDMTLKPNVLEDLARENFIAAPTPRRKFCSDTDEVMLEDESGRVRLVGDLMTQGGTFVTGTIMAALGAETPEGDFEVLQVCYAGLPPQPEHKPVTEEGEWVALMSGLEMGGAADAEDMRATLLAEWLLGDLGLDEDVQEAAKVTRLIVAGNGLAQPVVDLSDATKTKRYGYDSSTYSAKPTAALDNFLSEVLTALPVDLLPGASDPVGPTMPQQPIHTAMLPKSSDYADLHSRTNPFWCDIGGTSFFGNSGQPLDDIFKYLTTEDRLGVAQQTLEWSHIAPTCPDTLWCYPFSDRDPFILLQSPDVYYIGNQPKFETRLVEGTEGQIVRLILLPKFAETGEVVLVNTTTRECKVVSFGLGE